MYFKRSGGFIKPPVSGVSSTVGSGPTGPVVNNNGSMMQPTNAYNFSGIPASSRPMGYTASQTRQGEVE